MAYIRKQRNKWRVEVARYGIRKSAVFDTKAEAANWGAQEEAAILAAERGQFPRRSLKEAFTRYKEEVSSKKAGARWEMLRLDAFAEDFKDIAAKPMTDVDVTDMVRWRDARLKKVSKGTVQRDINLIRNVFTKARDEWKWCGHNPFKGMASPGDNPPRDVRIHWREVRRICRTLNYVTGKVETKQQEVAIALLIGLRTAMRAGEILSLTDDRVDLVRRVAKVPHKMQYMTGRMREIPLTRQGARLLGYLSGRGQLFTISSKSLDALFRAAKAKALIGDIHFHDSRAEALTRLSRKVDVMTLARISGHKDLRILMDTYYRESAADIAKRL